MNQRLQPTLALAVEHGPHAGVLAGLRRPGVAAVVWDRDLPAGVADQIDTHPIAALAPLRRRLTLDAVAPALTAWTVAAGFPPDAAAFLRADASALALAFAALLGLDALQLRLDVIRHDACSRFHVDNLRARLLCAYRGPGTEYAEAGPLAHGPISRLPRGAVGVFRGARWSPAERTALLHRSPPVEGTGATRLLLVIDPPDQACDCC